MLFCPAVYQKHPLYGTALLKSPWGLPLYLIFERGIIDGTFMQSLKKRLVVSEVNVRHCP